MVSSALGLLVFGGDSGGPLGCCEGDRDCMYDFGDGEAPLLPCGEGIKSVMGTLRGMAGPLRGEIADDDRLEKLIG